MKLLIIVVIFVYSVDAQYWGYGGLRRYGLYGRSWLGAYRGYFGYPYAATYPYAAYPTAINSYPYVDYGTNYVYGGYLGRRDSNEKQHESVECTFADIGSSLICSSKFGKVQCEASGMFDSQVYMVFAIAAWPTIVENSTKYSLYPENENGKGWLNTILMDDLTKENVTFSLYSGENDVKINDGGFKVKHEKCFERILGLLSNSKPKDSIIISSDGKENKEIEVIGQIYLI